MGTGSGKKDREKELQKQADTATAAIVPSAYQQYQQPKDLQLIKDLDFGKDVKDVEGLRWAMDLFGNAGKDPDLSGVGLLGNNALAGGNAGQLGLISQQIKARTNQENQGLLYDTVQDARTGAMNRSQGFATGDDARNFGKANLSNQRYTAYLGRPKKPSIWETLLSGAAGAVGSYAGAGGAF